MKKTFSLFLATFLMVGLFAAGKTEEYRVKTSSPSGAPALALASLAIDNQEDYTFLSADTITAEFSNGTADFIIAPINAGAKLYTSGKSNYKLAAVVSWGNLFIASQREDFTLDDIATYGITMFGENTINAAICHYVLEKNNIVPASVNYLAGASSAQSLLLSDSKAIVVTAEPALTAARIKNENIVSYSVNELYKAATGYDGFTQAGLFVREQTLIDHPQEVEDYLKMVEKSCEKCTTDVEEVGRAAVALEILPNQKVAQMAIPNCNIRYMSALEAREQVEITANIDLTQFGGALPVDDFYYGTK